MLFPRRVRLLGFLQGGIKNAFEKRTLHVATSWADPFSELILRVDVDLRCGNCVPGVSCLS